MRFTAIRKFALSLPEVAEAPHHDYGSFRVRGKIFVTIPPGATYLHVFVGELERERACATYPEFVEKLFWGGKVVGVRLALEPASPAAVRSLVRQAWANKAPKALLAGAPGAANDRTGGRTP